jgi:DNA-binding CsgD family transcriptional regulator
MGRGTVVVGREAELEQIRTFVRGVADGSGALLIEGEAGVGKTTLWHSGLASAGDGTTLLRCRPVQAEATLSFAGLGDLLGDVVGDVLPELPAPQRRALEAALLLDESGRSDHRAVGAGTLSVLRALARERPVVLAVDDIQWLDRPSARALVFALRRMSTESVRLLASLRTSVEGGAPALESVELLVAGEAQRVRVGPLSVGAVERLLSERLEISLPRTVLLHLHATARGNPFFALELGRALLEAGALPGPGEPFPVPDDLHVLLLARVRRLPAEVRDVLLLVSLLTQPTEDTLARAVGADWDRMLERGRTAGIIDIDRDGIRFTHPLLASALAASASATQRRKAHARLAEAVDDPEQRARHLALAATGSDDAVAAELERAAGEARRRGAPDAAAELAELARTLTPPGRPHDLWRRCNAAGEARFAAGDSSVAADLFVEAAAVADAGPERADALLHLARVRVQHDDVTGARGLLEEALREAGDDVGRRATIEHDLAYPAFASGDLDATLRHARVAAELAERVDAARILSGALAQIALAELLLGHGLQWEMLDRARELEDWDAPLPAALRPSQIAAHIMSWTDRLDDSRALVVAGERELSERGDEGALPWVWYRLAELDCWTGDWTRGYERARAADRLALQTGQGAIRPPTCYAVALLAAHLGRVDEARAAADEGIAAATAVRLPIGTAANLAVHGFLELSLGEAERAHRIFAPLVAAARGEGLDDPSPLWWVADAIEAFVAVGEIDAAEALTEWVDARARAIDRAGGLAAAARGRALLAAATGRSADALAACDDALGHHDRASTPFPRARTTFTRGQIARRARKWGLARESLTEARDAFDRLGAALWSDRARDELARIGGRPAAPLELSESERRIAELVAAGRTNKEVAEVLFVSPRTVSSSLARIYRKLGVTSRTEMASRLGAQRPPQG